VKTELLRLTDAMAKVYRDKQPIIQLEVDDSATVRLENGDFLELAGNLVDNACKWCRTTVRIGMNTTDNDGIRFVVQDDGPGIPEDSAHKLLQRGMRLDESAPGQGIGLAVVREIAESYGGAVSISRSALGGASIAIVLPPTARD
jgi:two-component system sensor histidine kinase PhoQ